jgi:hypothetical protein
VTKKASKTAPLVKRADRDAKGRLLPGHKLGGPGYPLAKRMAKLKAAVVACATDAKVRKLMDKLHSMALDGDVAAAKVWLVYVIGKPDHGYDPRQGQADDGKRRQAYQPTPAEKRVLAQMLLREADDEDGVIETDGEEILGDQ